MKQNREVIQDDKTKITGINNRNCDQKRLFGLNEDVKYEVLLKEENRKIRHFRKAGRVVMNSLVELTNLNIFRD